jgi:hypothetical protein
MTLLNRHGLVSKTKSAEYESLKHEGLEVNVYRGEDGTIVVDLLGPDDDADNTVAEGPDIRVWMNEALIYAHGKVGDDLSRGGEIFAVDVKNQDRCYCGASLPENGGYKAYEFCSRECKDAAPHREINCPICVGPVCDLDGDSVIVTVPATEDSDERCFEATIVDKVYTLTYTHKHGADVGVYKTREGAIDAAHGLADERAEEWDDEEATARFKAEKNKLDALCIFDEVEAEWAYSEILEISETELRS